MKTSPHLIPMPKFKKHDAFLVELKERIEKLNISLKGNTFSLIKASLLVAFYPLLYLLIFIRPPTLFTLVECALLGFSAALIGFNVMHDACHGSLSRYKWVNKFFARSLEMLSCSSFFWKVKHNIIHHTYPNVDGIDDDISIPLIRANEMQPRKKIHKYQHIYWVGIYPLTLVAWITKMDFVKYFSRRIGQADRKPIVMSLKEHVIFWVSKISHLVLFILLPIHTFGFLWWLLGYSLYLFPCGSLISIVFQLAHVVEGLEVPQINEDTKIEKTFSEHQLSTTANFATKNRLIGFFIGGLNHQVEHHLRPDIHHRHYGKISDIVKELAKKYGYTYHEFSNTLEAIKSHVLYLKILGNEIPA